MMLVVIRANASRDVVQEAGDHAGRVAAFIAGVKKRLASISEVLYPEPESVTRPTPREERREPDSEP
jgi:hypothetical protein